MVGTAPAIAVPITNAKSATLVCAGRPGSAASTSGNDTTIVPGRSAPTGSARAFRKRAMTGPTSGAGDSARIATTGSPTMTATRPSPMYPSTIGTRLRGRRNARRASSGVRVPVVKRYSASADCTALCRSGAELLAERRNELVDPHADLTHRIALADRHGMIVERLEVHRHGKRRSEVVWPARTSADGLRLVVGRHEVRPNLGPDVSRERREALVLRERQHRDLIRSEVRTEPEHDASAFLVRLLVVGGAEDRVGRAVGADRSLDDVRDEPLVGHVVEVLELLPRELGGTAKVVVGAVVDALELVPSERERELEVRRPRGAVGALVRAAAAEAELVLRYALLEMPSEPRLLPLLVEARRFGRAREVLHLHLLELARSEDEVARRDLVPEGLPDLRDTERQLLA